MRFFPTRNLLLAGGVAALFAAVSASAQDRGVGTRSGSSVSGVEQAQTIDCRGQPATVSGTDNQISFVGDCPGLTVSGTDNRISITLRPGAPIRVSGVDNVVSWRVAGKGRPQVSVSGVGNSVAAAR